MAIFDDHLKSESQTKILKIRIKSARSIGIKQQKSALHIITSVVSDPRNACMYTNFLFVWIPIKTLHMGNGCIIKPSVYIISHVKTKPDRTPFWSI